MEPNEIAIPRGETFSIDIKIDTEGECINAIEGSLSFSNDLLQAVNTSTGSSIISLWPIPPKISQLAGAINFIGGIPGGYCGKISGDPGEGDIIAKLIFRADPDKISSNPAKINFLPGTQVLLNNGQGTSATLITKNAVVIIAGNEPSSENLWQKELEADAIPPEPFEIILANDASVFEGKYFIAFSTTDKQTGIDHYEVYEVPAASFSFSKKDLRTQSPYLLRDQSLYSTIIVKAVDKAGNIREATLKSLNKRPAWQGYLVFAVLFFVLLAGWLIIRFLRKNEVISR